MTQTHYQVQYSVNDGAFWTNWSTEFATFDLAMQAIWSFYDNGGHLVYVGAPPLPQDVKMRFRIRQIQVTVLNETPVQIDDRR